MPPPFQRVILEQSPFPQGDFPDHPLYIDGPEWPAWWVRLPAAESPVEVAYRLRLSLPEPLQGRMHIAADVRYELFLNGLLQGRGAEVGTVRQWPFDSYEVSLPAGEHTLVIRVWTMGQKLKRAVATSLQHGLMVCGEGPLAERLTTGTAAWEGQHLPARGWRGMDRYAVALEELPAEVGDLSWQQGQSGAWHPVEKRSQAVGVGGTYVGSFRHRLSPAMLPAMLDEPFHGGVVRAVEALSGDPQTTVVTESPSDDPARLRWQAWWEGKGSLTVPENSRCRVIIDLQAYLCAYLSLATSGGRGSRIEVAWEEALYTETQRSDHNKTHRDRIDGLYFPVKGDLILPGAGKGTFQPLWWRCGRYLMLVVETGDEALELASLSLRETRYPYVWQGNYESDDTAFDASLPILELGQAVCAHETFFDCPYYEQLMYAGDTYLQALITMATSRDRRLVRKGLYDMHQTRLPNGLTYSNYSPGGQIIPPFGLCWQMWLVDYLHWTDDPQAWRELLPGARAVLDFWLQHREGDGLMRSPRGWNFLDWVGWPRRQGDADLRWHTGAPPGGEPGHLSYTLNWMAVLALRKQALIESQGGEKELATRYERIARELAGQLNIDGWDAEAGLYRNAPEPSPFTQHPQALAILSGLLPPDRAEAISMRLATDDTLVPATVYFSHYVLEALYQTGNWAGYHASLQRWREMPTMGYLTPYEVRAEATRSDCHAWGSHPLYHAYASTLGIRPDAAGFGAVVIKPLLGAGHRAKGTLPHPKGDIRVALEHQTDGTWTGNIELPKGLPARLILPGQEEIAFEGELEL